MPSVSRAPTIPRKIRDIKPKRQLPRSERSANDDDGEWWHNYNASNPFAFPVGVWSSPEEAAYYGLSTQQCKEMGIDAGEGVALYAECLRGLVFSPNGLLKLVFDKSNGQIVGVHICGDDACELIHYGMELVKAERTIDDILKNLYSAVTFHEMYRIAARECP